jgi:hypothetical protein
MSIIVQRAQEKKTIMIVMTMMMTIVVTMTEVMARMQDVTTTSTAKSVVGVWAETASS